MSFQSVNEIEKFSFEDCQITKFEVLENAFCFELEALIVMPNNSQNTNYTESYAGTTKAVFNKAKILKGVKLGYKYYDANDNLIEEISDLKLSLEETYDFLKQSKDCYLYSMDKVSEDNGVYTYSIEIEIPNDEEYDTTPTSAYLIELSFSLATFKWDYYLNRVQR